MKKLKRNIIIGSVIGVAGLVGASAAIAATLSIEDNQNTNKTGVYDMSNLKMLPKNSYLYDKGLKLIQEFNNKNNNPYFNDYATNSPDQSSKTTLKTTNSLNVPIIITNLGPIVYNLNNLYLLNWFGNIQWEINLGTQLSNYTSVSANLGFWPNGRVWSNMIFSNQTGYLYILTIAGYYDLNGNIIPSNPNDTQKQYQWLVPINVQTGTIVSNNIVNTGSRQLRYVSGTGYGVAGYQLRNLSILGNGNIMGFQWGPQGVNQVNTQSVGYFIFNPFTNTLVTSGVNLLGNLYDVTGINPLPLQIINIIPFSNNQNLVLLSFNLNPYTVRNTNGFDGQISPDAAFQQDRNWGSGSVFSVVVDNDFNIINGQQNWFSQYNNGSTIGYKQNLWPEWNGASENGISISPRANPYYQYSLQNFGYSNNYYIYPNGNILIPIFNKAFLLQPNSSITAGYTYSEIDLPLVNPTTLDPNLNSSYTFTSGPASFFTGTFFSASFDKNGNLYFNMGQGHSRNPQSETATWTSSPQVYKLSITNGQMAIYNYINITSSTNPEITQNSTDYVIRAISSQVGKIMLTNSVSGIAIAVEQDPKDANNGIILGTLNGSDPFQTQPKITLNPQALLKPASQFSSNDLIANNNGNISNVSINITNDKFDVNDEAGTISISATLSYLPWFESKGGTEVVTNFPDIEYSGFPPIKNFVIWQNSLPINLANSFYNLITLSDVERSNLLNTSIPLANSNTIYSIISQTQNSIELRAIVNYTSAINNKVVLSYTTTHTYNNNQKIVALNFLGGNPWTQGTTEANTTPTNVNNISSLLNFSNNNMLPSVVAQKLQNAYRFVDLSTSSGIPLNLIDFNMVPNDANDSIIVSAFIPGNVLAQIPSQYLPTDLPFWTSNALVSGLTFPGKTYTGFATSAKNSIQFNFSKNNGSDLNYSLEDLNYPEGKTKLQSLLASQVSISDIYKYILSIVGFNASNALSISMIPNNRLGTLAITIKKMNDWTNISTNNPLFSAQSVTINVSGFQLPPSDEANIVGFIAPDNEFLSTLQANLPTVVTEENAKKLLIIGKNVNQDSSNFTIQLVTNDLLGELTIIVNLKTNILDNINYPLQFVHTFSGFANNAFSNEGKISISFFSPASIEQALKKANVNIATLSAQEVLDNINSIVRTNQAYNQIELSNIDIFYDTYNNLTYIVFNLVVTAPNAKNPLPTTFGITLSWNN